MKKIKTVDAYVNSFPIEVRATLTTMRRIIRQTAPTVVESISYGMPGYKLGSKPLVYFAAYKWHLPY